ncbi:hypothetical protein VP01_928g7 [Puccinia sorghi]|uniref:Uncharacterized protein n=1 Tax=Puccinia sorghi TaxID=27349 RepID=A0A0L6U736_9BASI|nr:hypothetical protein VP01_928g7 [Puccinia sorghi]
MVLVKYSSDIKSFCMCWFLEGKLVESINSVIGCAIHPHSCAQWNMLYMSTRDMLQKEEVDFILSILEADPTLYLDGMQKQLEEATGEKVALSTIHNSICPIKRAQYTINISSFPANFLVFMGKLGHEFLSHGTRPRTFQTIKFQI